MELNQIRNNTYYIQNDTNIGVYKTGTDQVCIIDTGSRGDGEKIDEIINNMGWSIEYIINTHTHIDHLGGNEYLMKKYNIPAYCTAYDMAFAHYSDLEAAYMTGGHPCEMMKRIFSHPGMIGFDSIERNTLKGIKWTYLPGHTFSMMGIKTDDDVWFLGDAYLSNRYIEHYRFGYLYDVAGYLATLEKIKTLDGEFYVPSHGEISRNISGIADMNVDNILDITEIIKSICSKYISLDCILQEMYKYFRMKPSIPQHALLSSTTKCYLTYLQDRQELCCEFIEGVMKWKTVS